MIKPSVNDLSQNKYNRYVLCVASSKCARLITQNSKDSETVGKEILSGEKTVLPPEEKSIISAIHKLHEGKYVIVLPEEKPQVEEAAEAEENVSEEEAAETEAAETEVSEEEAENAIVSEELFYLDRLAQIRASVKEAFPEITDAHADHLIEEFIQVNFDK